MSFVIQSVNLSDYDSLFQLTHEYSTTNFPADKDIIKQKIQISLDSFSQALPIEDRNFLFVLKDHNNIIGSSQIRPIYGTQQKPYHALKIYKDNLDSFLLFQTHTKGVSYLGGLVLHSLYRGHPEKLGQQISLIRLVFAAMNLSLFQQIIYTEINPFWDIKGKNPFFEHFSLKYSNEVKKDVHTANLKKWIERFPKKPISFSDLPLTVRKSLGQANPWSQRAARILKKQNFHFINKIHPLDGAPCLQANTKQIPIIQKTKRVFLSEQKRHKKEHNWLWGKMFPNQQFKGGVLTGELIKDRLFVSSKYFSQFDLQKNDSVYVSDFNSQLRKS